LEERKMGLKVKIKFEKEPEYNHIGKITLEFYKISTCYFDLKWHQTKKFEFVLFLC